MNIRFVNQNVISNLYDVGIRMIKRTAINSFDELVCIWQIKVETSEKDRTCRTFDTYYSTTPEDDLLSLQAEENLHKLTLIFDIAVFFNLSILNALNLILKVL